MIYYHTPHCSAAGELRSLYSVHKVLQEDSRLYRALSNQYKPQTKPGFAGRLASSSRITNSPPFSLHNHITPHRSIVFFGFILVHWLV